MCPPYAGIEFYMHSFLAKAHFVLYIFNDITSQFAQSPNEQTSE